MNYEIIKKCRVCNSEEIAPVLYLGDHPLANGLKRKQDEAEDKYPLTLSFCFNCSLVQIKETVSKDILFGKYFWVTGTSFAANKFANDFYENVKKLNDFNHGDLVVEIASNDGTFLKPFINNNIRAVGVDPASNIADMANQDGVKTVNAFWNEETAKNIVQDYGNVKFVFARNVIPHVSELQEVVAAIYSCLADDGFGAVEFHYAGNILEQLQYDSIYHEHLSYFTITTIKTLLNRHNLHPFHIDLSPISGGAYVVYFSKKINNLSDSFKKLMDRENQLSVNAFSSWESFSKRCNSHKESSKRLIESLSKKTIVGFGASARSSTYLNFCNFTVSDISAIIDNNKLKQGLFSPGSSIPIVPFDKGLSMEPEIIFNIAWNFKDEIIKTCRGKGYTGSFLIPFPSDPYLIE